MASFDVENENKGGSKLSEDTHKALLDGCLANGIINTAIGLGSGVALSAVLFKRKMWPAIFGAGFGIGNAYSDCSNSLNHPHQVQAYRISMRNMIEAGRDRVKRSVHKAPDLSDDKFPSSVLANISNDGQQDQFVPIEGTPAMVSGASCGSGDSGSAGQAYSPVLQQTGQDCGYVGVNPYAAAGQQHSTQYGASWGDQQQPGTSSSYYNNQQQQQYASQQDLMAGMPPASAYQQQHDFYNAQHRYYEQQQYQGQATPVAEQPPAGRATNSEYQYRSQ